jgi:CDP-glycerol glycerophosphotransferase (TagB/SpsB family)
MIALKWNVLKIAEVVFDDIKVALTVYDNRCTYGCDFIAIAGEWERQTLINRGVSKSKIIVTGNPLINYNVGSVKNDLRATLGIKENKIILFLTSSLVKHGQWTVERQFDFVNKVIDSVSPLLDKAKLVIKIHPIESLEDYQRMLAGRKEDIIIRKGSLYDAINMSDLVIINGYSTTVLEAASLHKPVILLNIYDEIKDVPYVEFGLARGIYKIEDLEYEAKEMIYNQDYRQAVLHMSQLFLDSNREFVDGKATERITDLIMGVIK